MRRDWDLLRWILAEAESCPGGYPLVLTNGIYSSSHCQLVIGERNFGDVCEHMLLLGDAGLAEVRSLRRTYDGPSGVVIDRLTMAGHEFLEASRNENIWSKSKAVAQSIGGMTVTMFKDLLVGYVKSEVKKATGIDI